MDPERKDQKAGSVRIEPVARATTGSSGQMDQHDPATSNGSKPPESPYPSMGFETAVSRNVLRYAADAEHDLTPIQPVRTYWRAFAWCM
mgnify:CR=1 FL=1|jgi:hypothetical protein